MLGGTQSLHTNSMDETIALPSDKAVKIALRTQQIIAHELGVTETIDPLAGSYYVESSHQHSSRRRPRTTSAQIDAMGGVVAGIEQGFFQREIGRAAYQYQQEMEKKQRVIVGVNEYVETRTRSSRSRSSTSARRSRRSRSARSPRLKRTRDNRACTGRAQGADRRPRASRRARST